MCGSLPERLIGTLDRPTRLGELSEGVVDTALRVVRHALLESDVSLALARPFTDQIIRCAVGCGGIKADTPGQVVVKIVHGQLLESLAASAESVDLNAPAPVVIMMVGLQGSGKTTTTAKIAK